MILDAITPQEIAQTFGKPYTDTKRWDVWVKITRNPVYEIPLKYVYKQYDYFLF